MPRFLEDSSSPWCCLFILWLIQYTAGCSDRDAPTEPFRDLIAPAAIADLRIGRITESRLTLYWTAPGGDSLSGRIYFYELRVSGAPITPENWEQLPGKTFGHFSAPTGGNRDSVMLTHLESAAGLYVAMKAVDTSGNRSPLSNVVFAMTGQSDPLLHAGVLDGPNSDWHRRVKASQLPNVFLIGSGPGAGYFGTELWAIEISNLASPIYREWLHAVPSPEAVAVHNALIYVVGNSEHTGEFNSPRSLFILGGTPPSTTVRGSCRIAEADEFGTYGDMIFAGDYAYLSERLRVTIVDISDSASPQVVTHWLATGNERTTHIELSGSSLFCADGFEERGQWSVTVLDVSDPSNVVRIGSYMPKDDVCDIASVETVMYVLTLSGLEIVDISDPAEPTLVHEIEVGTVPVALELSGGHAFIIDSVGYV